MSYGSPLGCINQMKSFALGNYFFWMNYDIAYLYMLRIVMAHNIIYSKSVCVCVQKCVRVCGDGTLNNIEFVFFNNKNTIKMDGYC